MLEVYAKTCLDEDSETAKKWDIGPLTFDQISDRHKGKEWLGCRRFGVVQGTKVDENGKEKPKVRQIDDLSEFFVNACVACVDKITLCGVDGIVNFCRVWADAIRQAKADPAYAFEIPLDDGSVLRGTFHEELRAEGAARSLHTNSCRSRRNTRT